MMVDPPFSYKGEGEGSPIEDRSPVMLASLIEAFTAVNLPVENSVFQVAVRRGMPADTFALFGESFESFPVGGKQKKYVEMSDEEFSAEMAQNSARRQILVPAMIVDPKLAYMHVAEGEVAAAVEMPEDDSEAYPVELLSERFMQTLFAAHRVINIPAAGVASLQRTFRSLTNTEGETETGESVDDQHGGGETAK